MLARVGFGLRLILGQAVVLQKVVLRHDALGVDGFVILVVAGIQHENPDAAAGIAQVVQGGDIQQLQLAEAVAVVELPGILLVGPWGFPTVGTG